jgi:hypothetical protein
VIAINLHLFCVTWVGFGESNKKGDTPADDNLLTDEISSRKRNYLKILPLFEDDWGHKLERVWAK